MKKSTPSKRYTLITKLIWPFMVLAMMAAASPCQAFRHLKEGQPIPEFSLKGIDGKTYDSSSIKNKICIITYFRTGQLRSEQALQTLKDLSEKFKDQPLTILAVTKDTDMGKIKDLNKTLNLPFPILYDEEALFYKDLGVFVFPVTAIFDRKTLLHYQYAGCRSDFHDELSGQIRLLLGLITKEELEKEHERYRLAAERG